MHHLKKIKFQRNALSAKQLINRPQPSLMSAQRRAIMRHCTAPVMDDSAIGYSLVTMRPYCTQTYHS